MTILFHKVLIAALCSSNLARDVSGSPCDGATKSKLIFDKFPSSTVMSSHDPLNLILNKFTEWVDQRAGATLVQDQTESCVDNVTFIRTCENWISSDCYSATAKFGFSDVDQRELLSNCQQTCGVCCACAGEITWKTEPAEPKLIIEGTVSDREVHFIATDGCDQVLQKSAMFIVSTFEVVGFDLQSSTQQPNEDGQHEDNIDIPKAGDEGLRLSSLKIIVPLTVIPVFLVSFAIAWYAQKVRKRSFDINNKNGDASNYEMGPRKLEIRLDQRNTSNNSNGEDMVADAVTSVDSPRRTSLMAKTFLNLSSDGNPREVLQYTDTENAELNDAMQKAKEWSQKQDAYVRRWSGSSMNSSAMMGETVYDDTATEYSTDTALQHNTNVKRFAQTKPTQDLLFEAVAQASFKL
eukprot:m.22948 g.22948  ORF g.22948 m.22948 type:complete len:408 (+) comp14010_c0_seq1:92-1315(+)